MHLLLKSIIWWLKFICLISNFFQFSAQPRYRNSWIWLNTQIKYITLLSKIWSESPPPSVGWSYPKFLSRGNMKCSFKPYCFIWKKNWVCDRVISWLVKVVWNFLSIVPFKYGKETPSSRLDHHIHAKPFKKVSTV